jgi:protein KRI1
MPRKVKNRESENISTTTRKPSLFEDDNDVSLTINKRYEQSFNERKQRQELGRLAELGLLKGNSEKAGEEDESEDDIGDRLTAGLDKQIEATIRAIRSKDPSIYDPSKAFFNDTSTNTTVQDDEDVTEQSNRSNSVIHKSSKKSKLTAKDVLREQLVAAAERGETDAFAEDEEDDEDKTLLGGNILRTTNRRTIDDGDRAINSRIYDDEQAELRRSFLETAKDAIDDNDDDKEKNGPLLRLRQKSLEEERIEAEVIARDREELRKKLKAKGGGVAMHADELQDPEGFLNAMMKSRAWKAIEDENADEDGEGEFGKFTPHHPVDDSEDDEEIWKAEDFEAQYNFRFEEQGGAKIQTYARGAAAAESLRRTDTKRKDERQRKKERKEEERAEKEAETRRLMNLKRAEIKSRISKIRDVAGADMDMARLAEVVGDDLDGDFDPEAHDRMMSQLFGDEYYGNAEPEDDMMNQIVDDNEEEGEDSGVVVDEKKKKKKKVAGWIFGDGPRPAWAGPSAEELASGVDDLGIDDIINADVDEENGNKGVGADDKDDDDDEEEEYDAAISGRKKRREGKRARVNKKKLSAIARAKLALAAEAREERNRGGPAAFVGDDPDEVLELGFEDVIAGGLKTRFKYNKVSPQDFGLTAEEILLLDDRDLNSFVGLRRIAPYRESEWVLPPKKRKKDLVILREKIKDEVDKLGLNKPNVIGGGRGEQEEEEEEEKIIEGDEEMATEPQVEGEDTTEVIMMDEAERKRQKRKRRQMKKVQAATKIEEEEKGEGDNVGAIDSSGKMINPSMNMNKKKKAKTDIITSKLISTTGISQSRKASYGL